MDNLTIIDHPLVQHHLTSLRDKNTPSESFRKEVHRLSFLLTYEATKDLQLTDCEVETPLEPTRGKRLAQQVGLVPILRAGLGMVDPILDLLPDSMVWHLGFYRDETTFKPVAYYNKLPSDKPVDVGLVIDPMLATGGSAIAALNTLHDWGVPDIRLLVLVASPDGVARIAQEVPQAHIYSCCLDERLDENAYIRPGLGDTGDRIFNTKT